MKFLLPLFALFVITSCTTQPEKASESIVSLNVVNNTAPYAVVRGDDGYLINIALDDQGSATDTLALPKDGYYHLIIGRERTAVYLMNGKDLGITLDASQFDESLQYSGQLGPENNYLAAKYLTDETFSFKEVYSKQEPEFVATINAFHSDKAALLKAAKIENVEFLEQETQELQYEHATNIETYEQYYVYFTKETQFKVSDKFYEELNGIDYSDTTAYRVSSAYRGLLSVHYNRIAQAQKNDSDFNATVAFLEAVDAGLPNGFAKEKLMTDHLQYGMRPDEGLHTAYQIYKNSNPSLTNLEAISNRYAALSSITKGKASPNFEYENFKGGTTSLSQLKGRYVYIDVWATWCGPCIREIPSLKVLEEDYVNKNIAFVSISIDEKEDYEKWRNMIPAKELGGIQLMADAAWNSQFVTAYAINGIPRFILLDPDGNIISADAPRPSDPELRELFDTLI